MSNINDEKEDYKEVGEEMEDIQEEEKDIDQLFKNIDNRFRKIENAMSILQKWLKKTISDVERIDNNFKLLLEK